MENFLKNSRETGSHGLTIDYAVLGTININELIHAVWEDIQIAKDTYNIHYVNGFKLYLPVVNEFGDPVKVRHPAGPVIHRLYTSHYRPACKDYNL